MLQLELALGRIDPKKLHDAAAAFPIVRTLLDRSLKFAPSKRVR
jgi:hypothetical protein